MFSNEGLGGGVVSGHSRAAGWWAQVGGQSPEVVCTVRLAIGFLLVLSKWCAQSRLAIGF